MKNFGIEMTRRNVLLILFCIGLLFIAVAGFTGGILVVKTDKKIEGFIKPFDTRGYSEEKIENSQDPISLEPGGWKIFFKPLGRYVVEVRDGTQKTLYLKEVSPFSVNILASDFSLQKRAENLGFSGADCIKESKNNLKTTYFYCGKFVDSQAFVSTTSNSLDFTDTEVGYQNKIYDDKILTYIEETEELPKSINLVGEDGTSISWVNSEVALKILGSEINFNHIITSNSSSYIGIYDKAKTKLLLYSNFEDKTPIEIDLSKFIKKSDPVSFDINRDNIYVFRSKTKSEMAGIGETEPNKTKVDQKIIRFDAKSGKKTNELDLPDDMSVDDIVIYNTGDILFSSDLEGEPRTILIKNDKLKTYSLPTSLTGPVCLNGSEFYYLSSDTGEIFNYNQKNESFNLVYSNPSDKVVSMQCDENNVYFASLSKDSTLNSSDYRWFRLLGNLSLDSNVERDESIFPIVDDTLTGIDWSYQYKNTVYIILKNNSTCEITTDERGTLIKNLSSLGLFLEGKDLKISKNC